jgi:hypothetical protein
LSNKIDNIAHSGLLFQPRYPVNKPLLVLLFRTVGVLHGFEGVAGKFSAITTIVILPLVYSTVVQWTCFSRHHFFGPKCLAFNLHATRACFIEKFAFVANKAAV